MAHKFGKYYINFKQTGCASSKLTQQRPRKHFESGGTLAKRVLLYMTKIKDFMSFTSRAKIFENMEFLIGNGLYTVFTTA